MSRQSETTPQAFVRRLEAFYPANHRPVPLHAPWLTAAERASIEATLRTGFVSTAGPEVQIFEKKLARHFGCPFVIATVNGTTALRLALQAAGVGPEDEVLVPSLTFIGTVNPVLQLGATPSFVDIEGLVSRSGSPDLAPNLDGLVISRRRVEAFLQAHAIRTKSGCVNRRTGRRIAALVPVHLMGNFAPDLSVLAARWGIPLIEDAAEAVGTRPLAGRFVRGLASILSFNGNKILTSGGGGAILTHDRDFAARAQQLARQGRRLSTSRPLPEPLFETPGFNDKMPALNATLGGAQLDRLEEILAAKRALWGNYAAHFAENDALVFLPYGAHNVGNSWLGVLYYRGRQPRLWIREALGLLRERGIEARPFWRPLPRVPFLRAYPSSGGGQAEMVWRRCFMLPGSPELGVELRGASPGAPLKSP